MTMKKKNIKIKTNGPLNKHDKKCNKTLDVQKTSEKTNRKKQLWKERGMVKFLKVIDDLIIAILGKSLVEKRSGEDRRVKKPRKRKHEKRLAGKSSDRRK